MTASRRSASLSMELTALLKSQVLFPHNTFPVSASEGLSARQLKSAHLRGDHIVCLTIDGEDGVEKPQVGSVGTLAKVINLLTLPDGSLGAVLKGECRVKVRRVKRVGKSWRVRAEPVAEGAVRRTAAFQARVKSLRSLIMQLLQGEIEVSPESRALLSTSDDPFLLCDLVTPYLTLNLQEKLGLLTAVTIGKRMQSVIAALRRELSLQKLSRRIHAQVQGDLSEEARRQYLKDQILAIKRELGETDDGSMAGEELAEQLAAIDLPGLAREAVDEELGRLQLSAPGTPEYLVSHSYLTLMRDLPWESSAPAAPNLAKARRILNRAHYGLDDVKNRILEYLAVMQHRGELPGQILLLSGPPGVGKTSLVKAIAEALGRPFARMALGGVKDEAEIRGHRRTYIGAMPGKIVQAIKQAKSQYPVILLDEIDKIGGEHQGGIGAALLEVLDREQNHSFIDHYLAVPFDISRALFVATANNPEEILEPLRDRMEMVDLASYTDQDKLAIVKRHIVPLVRKEMKLTAKNFQMTDPTVMELIRSYTREAGVRQLKREITRLGRKVVLKVVTGEANRSTGTKITPKDLPAWLGVPRFIDEPNDAILLPGVAIGLAYTSVGGEILYIETSVSPSQQGKGSLKLTGNVGKMMEESAQAVLSYLSREAAFIGIDAVALAQSDIHIHLPDGGTPKDGPSAGIAIMCALVSGLTGRALPHDLAMTGEVTLRGQVLPVGGVREKILAAHRYGKTTVLYPARNGHDLADVPAAVQSQLNLVPVTSMAEVLVAAGLTTATWQKVGINPTVDNPTSFLHS